MEFFRQNIALRVPMQTQPQSDVCDSRMLLLEMDERSKANMWRAGWARSIIGRSLIFCAERVAQFPSIKSYLLLHSWKKPICKDIVALSEAKVKCYNCLVWGRLHCLSRGDTGKAIRLQSELSICGDQSAQTLNTPSFPCRSIEQQLLNLWLLKVASLRLTTSQRLKRGSCQRHSDIASNVLISLLVQPEMMAACP